MIGHGATVALVDHDGLVLPVLDYEFSGPDALAADYDRLRPDFAVTGSPRMPGGLNIGATTTTTGTATTTGGTTATGGLGGLLNGLTGK